MALGLGYRGICADNFTVKPFTILGKLFITDQQPCRL